jgi:hypothetical protein
MTIVPKHDESQKKIGRRLVAMARIEEVAYVGEALAAAAAQAAEPPAPPTAQGECKRKALADSTCDVCSRAAAKYRCPRCAVATCSLACSNRHKAEGAGCSGKRSRAAFVPMARFGDADLHADYHFLEEGSRMAGSARRHLHQNCGGMPTPGGGKGGGKGKGGKGKGKGKGGKGKGGGGWGKGRGGGGGKGKGWGPGGGGGYGKGGRGRGQGDQQPGAGDQQVVAAVEVDEAALTTLPPHLSILVRECAVRGVRLRLMPHAMSRRVSNTTFFHHRRAALFWRLAWHFPCAAGCAGGLHTADTGRALDSATLGEVLGELLAPAPANAVVRAKLRRYLLPGTSAAVAATAADAAEASASSSTSPTTDDAAAAAAAATPAAAPAVADGAREDDGGAAADGDGPGGGGDGPGGGGSGGGKGGFQGGRRPEMATALPLRIFLLREPPASADARYYAVDPRATIREVLAGKSVLEFPRLFVLPADAASDDPVFPLVGEEGGGGEDEDEDEEDTESSSDEEDGSSDGGAADDGSEGADNSGVGSSGSEDEDGDAASGSEDDKEEEEEEQEEEEAVAAVPTGCIVLPPPMF